MHKMKHEHAEKAWCMIGILWKLARLSVNFAHASVVARAEEGCRLASGSPTCNYVLMYPISYACQSVILSATQV